MTITEEEFSDLIPGDRVLVFATVDQGMDADREVRVHPEGKRQSVYLKREAIHSILPAPIVVGSKVTRVSSGYVAVVVHIDGEWAMVRWQDSTGVRAAVRLEDLVISK